MLRKLSTVLLFVIFEMGNVLSPVKVVEVEGRQSDLGDWEVVQLEPQWDRLVRGLSIAPTTLRVKIVEFEYTEL